MLSNRARALLMQSLITCTGTALGLSACAHETITPVTVTPQSPSVFVRASYDGDATNLIGSFIPDDIPNAEVDESQSARLRCSDFIKVHKIPAGGHVDEKMSASAGLKAKIGIPKIANGSFGRDTSETVYVRYDGIQKLEAEITDTKGFEECCALDEAGCSERFIATALMATGDVYVATSTDTSAGLDGTGAVHGLPVNGEAFYSDGFKWERKTSFKNQFFSFTLRRSTRPHNPGSKPKAPCDWVDNLPTSLDGQFFVGISAKVQDEGQARDWARQDARSQVVKYLGEFISDSSTRTTETGESIAALKTALNDKQVATRISEGVARLVKDQKYCPTQAIEMPDGTRYVSRVLSYFPNSERDAAIKTSLSRLVSLGKLTSEQAALLTPPASKAP